MAAQAIRGVANDGKPVEALRAIEAWVCAELPSEVTPTQLRQDDTLLPDVRKRLNDAWGALDDSSEQPVLANVHFILSGLIGILRDSVKLQAVAHVDDAVEALAPAPRPSRSTVEDKPGFVWWRQQPTSKLEQADIAQWEGPPDEKSVSFVIGPGVLREESNDAIYWPQNGGFEEGDRSFLGSLWDTRAAGRKKAGRTGDLPEVVADLQKAAVRASRIATETLADYWKQRKTVPADWGAAGVPKTASSGALKPLEHAAMAAYAAHKKAEREAGDLLGVAAIEARLRAITEAVRESGLSPASVRWLTDLAWHVLTFDSPMYPLTEELALQVSLALGHDRPTKAGPPAGLLPEIFDPESVGRELRIAVERGLPASIDQTGSSREQFYVKVAKRLREGLKSGHLPVAIVTGFDIELERALIQPGETFHVAVPAYAIDEGSATGGFGRARVVWLVGDFSSEESDSNGEWRNALQYPKNNEWRLLNDRDESLPGPLVVHLSGSPLHRYPGDSAGHGSVTLARAKNGKYDPDKNRKYAPAVRLGDLDSLQLDRVEHQMSALRMGPSGEGGFGSHAEGLPRWLIDQLRHQSRYWLFVGCRYRDWSSRMQLFLELTSAMPHGRAAAVDPRHDADLAHLFHWAQVQLFSGTAGDLVGKL